MAVGSWTAAEDALLVGYAKGVLSVGEIAAKTGRTAAAVTARAHKLGLAKRVWNKNLSDAQRDEVVRLYSEGLTITEIQNRTGFSYHQVRWFLTQKKIPVDRSRAAISATEGQRKKFSDQEKVRLEELWNAGVSLSEIRTELGCCKQVLEKYVHQQGWERDHFILLGNIKQRRQFSSVELANICRVYIEGGRGLEETAKKFGTSKHTLRRVLREAGVDISDVFRKKLSERIRQDYKVGRRKVSAKAGRGIHSYYDTPFQGRVLMRSSDEVRYAKMLDQQGKTWFYEVRNYLLSSGRSYTPDFWVSPIPKTTVQAILGGTLNKRTILAFLDSIRHDIIDVKGWWNSKHLSWEKINLFRKDFSALVFRLAVNDKKGGWIWE